MRGFFRVAGLTGLALVMAVCAMAEGEECSLLAEGEFFRVCAVPGLSSSAVLQKIDYDYAPNPHLLIHAKERHTRDVLGLAVDTLFLEIADTLDIHTYTFKGEIRILADKDSVNSVFRELLGDDFHQGSFYLPDKRIIYIAYDEMTLGMLGHEMAHALMSHYFVVPPSEKIQEILSGYVEFRLRKAAGTLPEGKEPE